MKTTANILVWALAVLLAFVFLFAGGAKLLGSRAMIQEFTQIGAGQWLRYVTGVLEILGALGVLVPRYRFWAALQLAAVMAGATAINLFVLHTGSLARLTVVLLLLSLVFAWLRRPQNESGTVRSDSPGGYRMRTRA